MERSRSRDVSPDERWRISDSRGRFEVPDASAIEWTDRRLIGVVEIIEAERHIAGHASKAGPRAMHIQRTPWARCARPNDATTISETNPLMINKGIRQPKTRERLADNLSVEYS